VEQKCGNGQSLQCFRIYICVSKGSEFEWHVL
jgi:hypothetical protein